MGTCSLTLTLFILTILSNVLCVLSQTTVNSTSDPLAELCFEYSLPDAFLHLPDGSAYMLKGQFFWEIASDRIQFEDPKNAMRIADHFEEVTGPVQVAFALPSHPFNPIAGTVILVENNTWFHYRHEKNGQRDFKLLSKGNAAKWSVYTPQFDLVKLVVTFHKSAGVSFGRISGSSPEFQTHLDFNYLVFLDPVKPYEWSIRSDFNRYFRHLSNYERARIFSPWRNGSHIIFFWQKTDLDSRRGYFCIIQSLDQGIQCEPYEVINILNCPASLVDFGESTLLVQIGDLLSLNPRQALDLLTGLLIGSIVLVMSFAAMTALRVFPSTPLKSDLGA